MQRTKNLIYILILLFLTPLAVNAIDEITATVDRTNVSINEAITLSIAISNPKLFGTIDFPRNTADYQVVATSTSSNIQIINGRSSHNKTYTFVLKPKHSGKFTIPAASTNDGINTFRTDPIPVSISAQPATSNKTTRFRNSAPQTRAPVAARGNNVFAKVELSNYSPYNNEQVLLKLKLYHRGNLRSISIPPMKLDQFIQRKDDKAKEYQETVNGRGYLVYEVSYIVFPIKSGVIKIPSHKVEAIIIEDATTASGFDPFRLMNPFLVDKKIILNTDPITLNVKQHPPGAPRGFTGYVGELVVNNEINNINVKAGDAITVKSKVYGNGNLKSLDLKRIKESKLYSIFQDKEETSEEINNGILYFETISKTAVIPNKQSGKIAIETLPMISFNPKTGKYESHGKEYFEINILPGTVNTEEKDNDAPKNKTIKENKVEDILTISSQQISLYKRNPLLNEFYLLIILLLLNLTALSIYLYKKLQENNVFESKETNLDFATLLLQIKKAENLVDISKTVKELVSKSQDSIDLELQEKVDAFFDETDRSNYGLKFSSDSNSEAQQLEYFRLSATNIIKELKEASKGVKANA